MLRFGIEFIYPIEFRNTEIFPFKKWFPKISWKGTELLLLVIGVIGAFIASSTGETAEHLINKNHQLIGIHSTFAGISTFLYSLLLIGEIFFLINPTIIPKLNLRGKAFSAMGLACYLRVFDADQRASCEAG